VQAVNTRDRLARPRHVATLRRHQRNVSWAFLLPAVVIHVVVVAVPCIITLALAFTSWNGLGIPKFNGLDNFRTLFTGDPVFYSALLNNVQYAAIFLTIPVIMGLGGALLIRSVRSRVLQMAYRTIFYLPATISTVVVARIWAWIYHPIFGINQILPQIGLGTLALPWLSSTQTALYAVAFADNWRWWGFLMVMFLTALQQIDPTLYEAAHIDGANAWQAFWHVTVPLLRSTFVFVALTTFLGSFLVIELIYVMTSGGPANATQVLAYWIYSQAVYMYHDGYASAMALTLAVLLSIVIGAFVFIRQKGWDIV
jgi:raffinose/stachyose/melibiose transport system permease protein